MWTGAISFGLVTVPVKLYSAVSRKTVRFHQLNGKTGVRIQQRRAHERIGAAGALQRGLERPLHGGGLGLGERRLDGHRRASSSAELSRTVTSGKAVSISTPEDSVPTGADPSRRWTRHQMKNPRVVKQP